MGYTHYWRFGPIIEEKAYKTALTECRKIIKASPVPLGNGYGEGKPKLNNGIWINGLGEDAHETFALDRTPERPSDFCKTQYKPYDIVVTACLAVLQHHLGKSVGVASDGCPHEWEAGCALASKVLGKTIPIPPQVLGMDGFVDAYREQYLQENPQYAKG